jgi:DNA-binding IclR family transcriptional regulator
MSRFDRSKPATIGVLAKVFKILDLLQAYPSGLDLNSVSQRTGIHKSTTYRFLACLEQEGYLVRNEQSAYVLGVKLLQLGAVSDQHHVLRESSDPSLRELWQATAETVNLGVLEGGNILFLRVLESPHAFRLVSGIGARRSLHCTAMGKALAAFLPSRQESQILNSIHFEAVTPHTLTNLAQFKKDLERIRYYGYALNDEESVLGARAIGAPVLNAEGTAVAAVSVSGPITRITEGKIPILAEAVKRTAREIAARLGYDTGVSGTHEGESKA